MGQVIGAEAAEIIDGSPIAFSISWSRMGGPGSPGLPKSRPVRGRRCRAVTAAPLLSSGVNLRMTTPWTKAEDQIFRDLVDGGVCRACLRRVNHPAARDDAASKFKSPRYRSCSREVAGCKTLDGFWCKTAFCNGDGKSLGLGN